MLMILRTLAVISAIVAFVSLGLSAMASTDMSRSREAHSLQLLVFIWLIVSIATPLAAAAIGRRHEETQALCYVPLLLIAAFAILRMIRF